MAEVGVALTAAQVSSIAAEAASKAATQAIERSEIIRARQLPTFDYEKVFWNTMWTEGLFFIAKLGWSGFRITTAIGNIFEDIKVKLPLWGLQALSALSASPYDDLVTGLITEGVDKAEAEKTVAKSLTADPLTIVDYLLIDYGQYTMVSIPIIHGMLEASRMRKLRPDERKYKLLFAGGLGFLALLVLPQILNFVGASGKEAVVDKDVEKKEQEYFVMCDVNEDGVIDETDIMILEAQHKLFTAHMCRRRYLE